MEFLSFSCITSGLHNFSHAVPMFVCPHVLRPFEWTIIERRRNKAKSGETFFETVYGLICDGISIILPISLEPPPYHRLVVEGRVYSFGRDDILADLFRELQSSHSDDIEIACQGQNIYYDGVSIYCEGRRMLPETFLTTLLPSAFIELTIGKSLFHLKCPEFIAGHSYVFDRTFHVPIEVKTLFGFTKLMCMADLRQSVGSLKKRVETTTGIPVAMQSLLFDGHVLTDKSTLSSYGINSYSIIYVHQGLRGGGNPAAGCPDPHCTCATYREVTGCCNVCRQSCKCAECNSEEVNSLKLLKATSALINAGFSSNPEKLETPAKRSALLR